MTSFSIVVRTTFASGASAIIHRQRPAREAFGTIFWVRRARATRVDASRQPPLSRRMATKERMDELDARIKAKRSEHSCLHRFEEFTACMTPGRQLRMYYREGRHEECPEFLFRFTDCLESKIPSRQQQVQRRERERQQQLPGKHVWAFRPEYADEALERYGIRPGAARRAEPPQGPVGTVASTVRATTQDVGV
jgi:hypothetical protein